MKIVSMEVRNIKRISAVDITPESNVVELTGRNRQGKTSILDAIQWALDNNKVVQSKPVRDGADTGYIKLDLGEYIVTKKFRVKDGQEVAIALTVQNRDGAKYGSPQELLKGFYGTFTFDPLAFAEMKPREQVVALRALVPGYDFVATDTANQADFNERTDVNRQIRDLKPRIDAIVIPDDTPAERVSIDDLMAELSRAMDHNSKIDTVAAERLRVQEKIAHLNEGIIGRREAINDLQARIAELEKLNAAAEQSVAELEKEAAAAGALAAKQDLDPIRQRITEAETTNRYVAMRQQRDALVAELRTAEVKSDRLTKVIDDRKAAAAKAVREAKLPVSGLELSDEAVLLNGQPFEQASDAEKLGLSIAVAAAMSPKLRIARVRDGSKLDRAAMAALTQYADEHDLQLWIETVESSRPTAIVIEDGMVASQLEAAE